MKLSNKIEIELTNEDLEYIREKNTDDIAKYLSSLRDRKFKVGDVLVKKTRKTVMDPKTYVQSYYWDYVMVPYRKVPAKFVVVHVDDYGIPTVKRLSVKGHFTGNIQSLADADFRSEIYEEDPDYIEALLLDEEEYDPIKIERNRKKNGQIG